MARKKSQDSQRIYKTLLDVAQFLCLEKGVAGTTLDDIAAAAHKTRGAIYWHFLDKMELLHAMLEGTVLPMAAMLHALEGTKELDPLHALRISCIQVLMQLAASTERQCIFAIVFHKFERVGPLLVLLKDEQERRKRWQSLAHSKMNIAIERGILPADTDSLLVIQVIGNFMVGTMREWLWDTKSFDLGACAESIVDTLFSGVIANPPRRKTPAAADIHRSVV